MKEFVLSPALNKRLISNLLSSSSAPKENENFILKGSREFTSRSNDVFGQLKTMEKSHEAWICENNTHDPFEENSGPVKPDSSKRLEIASSSNVNLNSSREKIVVEKKTKESSAVFKKPQFTGINRKKKNVAKSLMKYGKKWTKYSLADIPLSSNAANASIAFSFLNELRKRKTESEEKSDGSSQILFSKPKLSHSSSVSSTSSIDVTSPGNSNSVDKRKKSLDTIKLSHLENDPDQDM